ncbi:MAG: ParB/RepB/Spo0J family partition protein [Solirubrobacterales bacterium]
MPAIQEFPQPLAGTIQSNPATPRRRFDPAPLEAALIENMRFHNLSRVEEARACATLINELGLTYRLLANRLGCSFGLVANLMSLLKLSENILEYVERRELGINHALALLKATDPEVREELARQAATGGWNVATLRARVCESNSDESAVPGKDAPARRLESTLAVATAWGDVLGVEVQVHLSTRGQTRLEASFNSPEAALASAARLEGQIAHGGESPGSSDGGPHGLPSDVYQLA